jgi:hypothetical protein
MSNIQQITIGDKTFNIGQADAQSQKKLLSMIGARLAFAVKSSGVKEVDTSLLVGNLLAMDESKFDDVAALVLSRVRVQGSDSPIDLKLFQNHMTDYFKLVAEAVKLNMDDFFTFILKDQPATQVSE